MVLIKRPGFVDARLPIWLRLADGTMRWVVDRGMATPISRGEARELLRSAHLIGASLVTA